MAKQAQRCSFTGGGVAGIHERGFVDSTMYSTASMLRTMELILGLKPMSQFDATVTPMRRSFTSRPDLRFVTALPSNVDLQQRSPVTAWGADLSRKMDFTKEDAADALLLNEVVWRSVRCLNIPMPARSVLRLSASKEMVMKTMIE